MIDDFTIAASNGPERAPLEGPENVPSDVPPEEVGVVLGSPDLDLKSLFRKGAKRAREEAKEGDDVGGSGDDADGDGNSAGDGDDGSNDAGEHRNEERGQAGGSSTGLLPETESNGSNNNINVVDEIAATSTSSNQMLFTTNNNAISIDAPLSLLPSYYNETYFSKPRFIPETRNRSDEGGEVFLCTKKNEKGRPCRKRFYVKLQVGVELDR